MILPNRKRSTTAKKEFLFPAGRGRDLTGAIPGIDAGPFINDWHKTPHGL